MEKLRGIASKKVLAVAERASKRAVFRNDMHNYWSAVYHTYLNIGERYQAISDLFPGITRVIHCSEILYGDILVSDFHSGMNLGFIGGELTPVKIRALKNEGGSITGEVLEVVPGDAASLRQVGKTGTFKNEIWYFISHKFVVIKGGRKDS